MYKFTVSMQIKPFKFSFNEVLNRLNIVVCSFFYLFYLVRIGLGKIFVNLSQLREERFVNTLKLFKWYLTKGNEVFNLNQYSVSDECIFRVVKCQLFYL